MSYLDNFEKYDVNYTYSKDVFKINATKYEYSSMTPSLTPSLVHCTRRCKLSCSVNMLEHGLFNGMKSLPTLLYMSWVAVCSFLDSDQYFFLHLPDRYNHVLTLVGWNDLCVLFCLIGGAPERSTETWCIVVPSKFDRPKLSPYTRCKQIKYSIVCCL